MGGHGGLNILPQKRWNVYNRDNRLKVQQDEAKAKEAEDAERARAEQAEREYRHQILLNRAHRRDSHQVIVDEQLPEPALVLPAPQSITESINNQQQEPQGHINFWQEDEMQAKAQHPEVEAAKKEEARKRGKTDYYTSDPKFDERFQLGYQMKGDQPWWAQSKLAAEKAPVLPTGSALTAANGHEQSSLPHSQNKPLALDNGLKESSRQRDSDNDRRWHSRTRKNVTAEHSSSDEDEQVKAAKQFLKQVLGGQLPKLDTLADGSSSGSSSGSESGSSQTSSERRHHRRKKRKREEPNDEECSSSQDDGVSQCRKSKQREKSSSEKRRHRKEKKRSKHKDKEKKRSKSRVKQQGTDGVKFKTVEELRAERLEREQGERSRARMVLVGALEGPDTSERAGYNSAFGYAKSIKKHR